MFNYNAPQLIINLESENILPYIFFHNKMLVRSHSKNMSQKGSGGVKKITQNRTTRHSLITKCITIY
jgi:hypothetical protein